jgi:hypothetical protein
MARYGFVGIPRATRPKPDKAVIAWQRKQVKERISQFGNAKVMPKQERTDPTLQTWLTKLPSTAISERGSEHDIHRQAGHDHSCSQAE